jgi:hypothetical protein
MAPYLIPVSESVASGHRASGRVTFKAKNEPADLFLEQTPQASEVQVVLAVEASDRLPSLFHLSRAFVGGRVYTYLASYVRGRYYFASPLGYICFTTPTLTHKCVAMDIPLYFLLASGTL